MTKITNEQINEIAESMPGYPDEFNWREFAHKLLSLQEQTILNLQVELAKVKKSRKKWRNRAIGGDFVNVESFEEKPEQAAKKLTHNGNTYQRGVWIEWCGGEDSPIPDGVKYRVRFGDGDESSWNTNASMSRWWKVGSDGDIVAFMIL